MGAGVTYDISAAQAIEGWMSDAELLWLAEQASKHERIVEIGSWKGRSTYVLGQYSPGSVIAIDHWLGQELTAETTPLDAEIEAKGSDAIYYEFLANISSLKNVVPQRMSSQEAYDLFTRRAIVLDVVLSYSYGIIRQPPDMVFLDGEHAYEGVSADIALWKPLIAPGGLLCGHDWWHEGIKRAVREAVPGFQVAQGTNIWYATVD